MESKETLFTSCACITNVQNQAITVNMNILRFSFMLAKVIKKKISKILFRESSNPQPIGFSGILLAKRRNSFYCTYFLHNRNVADTKSPYPIKRLEVIRWFNQKSMVFNQSLS